MSRASVKPASRKSCSEVSAICSTGSDGYPGKATDGILIRVSRSATTPDMRSVVLAAISCACMVGPPASVSCGCRCDAGCLVSEEDAADQGTHGDGHDRHDEHRDEEAVVEQLGPELGRAGEVKVGGRDLGAVGRQGVDAAQ